VNVPMNMCVVSKQGTSCMNFSVFRGPNVVSNCFVTVCISLSSTTVDEMPFFDFRANCRPLQ
jgi:hypothetical protein